MQEPHYTAQWKRNGKGFEVQIFGNVDKSDGFIYYSFYIDGNIIFVISKFDGDKWLMANSFIKDKQIDAEELGKLVDACDPLYSIAKMLGYSSF